MIQEAERIYIVRRLERIGDDMQRNLKGVFSSMDAAKFSIKDPRLETIDIFILDENDAKKAEIKIDDQEYQAFVDWRIKQTDKIK